MLFFYDYIMTNTLDQKIDKLQELLVSENKISNQSGLSIIHDIYHNEINGPDKLFTILKYRSENKNIPINFIDGIIFELLLQSTSLPFTDKLKEEYPLGIVPLKSDVGMDYSLLQKLLLDKQFQEADQVTQAKLCEVSQAVNQHSRSWLYFTDISSLPSADLLTIDKLWQVHSKGLFGLSVQRQIWLANNTNWDKFWNKIGWKIDNVACRYPQEFIWNIDAPAGHLPLFNQLRGVQVLAALFKHPVWLDTATDS